MDNIIPFALLCFTSFFTLVNPLGTMPIFLSMTDGLSNEERQAIARKATFVAFIILSAFTISGQYLFQFFGISTMDSVSRAALSSSRSATICSRLISPTSS